MFLDTSGLLSLYDSRDAFHEDAVREFPVARMRRNATDRPWRIGERKLRFPPHSFAEGGSRCDAVHCLRVCWRRP